MNRQEAHDRGVPNLWLLLEQLTIRTGCDTDLNRSADLAMREFSDLLAAPVPTPSADAEKYRCSGCGLRWESLKDYKFNGANLCGDCWRKAQPVLHAPSADARAKLEQDVVEDHSRALEFLRELDQFGLRVREWLHTERGETPQECGVVGEPESGRHVCRLPKGHEGYHQDGGSRWLGYHPKGETPQPAAEPRSRHVCGAQGYCPGPPHWDPICPACRDEADRREALPPVVQTRPE